MSVTVSVGHRDNERQQVKALLASVMLDGGCAASLFGHAGVFQDVHVD